MRKLNNKKFTCTPLSRKLYGSAMMHSPKCRLETGEVFIPLVITAFLAEFLPIQNLDSVPYIYPSNATLKEIMIDRACNTLLIERNKMKGVSLSLMCSKGEGRRKIDGIVHKIGCEILGRLGASNFEKYWNRYSRKHIKRYNCWYQQCT